LARPSHSVTARIMTRPIIAAPLITGRRTDDVAERSTFDRAASAEPPESDAKLMPKTYSLLKN
jgi:hypothetical protein